MDKQTNVDNDIERIGDEQWNIMQIIDDIQMEMEKLKRRLKRLEHMPRIHPLDERRK